MGYFKTAILMAAMTALFMGLGYLLGGTGGALIALVVATARAERGLATILTNLVQDPGHGLRHALELGVGLEQLDARRLVFRLGLQDVALLRRRVRHQRIASGI